MSDVFISYRHGTVDSLVAARLRDTLEDHVDVYFDRSRQSNDLGDDFAKGIDEALASCRVLFAVIGPDWTSKEGLTRLEQPNDWVRRELRIALGRESEVRVVPLFYGIPKGVPDFSKLPEDIRTLGRRNGRPLDPDDWDVETDDLVERLTRDWLAVKRSAVRAAAPVPPELPYLCDRVDQETHLVDIVRDQPLGSPIACVVHGHKWEEHEGFLSRLHYGNVLEDIFDARETGVAVYPVQLSRERLRNGRFADALRSALKGAVLQQRTATDADLRLFFTKLLRPLVAVVQLTASEFSEMPENPVHGLIDGWREMLAPANGAAAALPHPALLWVNVAYDDVKTELSAKELVLPLPKLPPVESVHIREWLALDVVKPWVGVKRRQLEDLADQPQHCYEPGKIHMRTFVDVVREILDAR